MWPFDWWKAKCPVGFREKAWIELRMQSLLEHFGTRQFTQGKIVLPTEEFFPDPFDASPEAARRLLDRVCEYMGVSSAEIELQTEPAGCSHDAAVTCNPNAVRVTDAELADPMRLAAVFTRELAYRELARRKLVENPFSKEWTTDLAAVLLAMGVFVANATATEKHAHSGSCGCSTSGGRSGLPNRATAYAMALHAWLRGEQRPDWGRYLRPDAAEAFQAGFRYLVQTEDSLLRPDNLHRLDTNPSLDRLCRRLDEGTASDRVAALWQIAERGAEASTAAAAVARCLNDRRPGVCAEAARTLAELGPAAADAVPELVDMLGHSDQEVRTAAAYALGKLHSQPELVVTELAERLGDPGVLETAAWSLAQFGADARPALPSLLARLKGELGRGHRTIDYLTYAVRAISADAEAELRELVESCDPELQRQADGLLPEGGQEPSPPGQSRLSFWEAK